MKNLKILIITLLIGISSLAHANPLPKQIMVHNKTLMQKFQESKNGVTLVEYIPKNQNFDNYTLMLAIRFIPGKNLSAIESAYATADNIEKRKENGDGYASSVVLSNGTDAIADFLMSDGNKILEHNSIMFIQTKEGLLSYQIVHRDYFKNFEATKKFVHSINKKMESNVNELQRIAIYPSTKVK